MITVTLTQETSNSDDVSIVVDNLRASTSINIALTKFKEIIPVLTPEEAQEKTKEYDAVLAGERNGATLPGFDIGNSPDQLKKLKTGKTSLILTTTNGTRILKQIQSKTILIGALNNAQAVAKTALEKANHHINIVMAGRKGEFAIEDYLASGEIIYQIQKTTEKIKLSPEAEKAINDSRDYNQLKETILSSPAAENLEKLGFHNDIILALEKNKYNKVAIYENNKLKGDSVKTQ